MSIRNLSIGCSWVIIALLGIQLNPALADETVGSSAPDFTLPGDRGLAVSLSEFRGQVVMIT